MLLSEGCRVVFLPDPRFFPSLMLSHVLSGYETNVPVDSMQGLEIGSQHGSTYGPVDNLADMGPPPGDLNFENLESTLPQDSQGMAWFDTDL